MLDPGIWDSEQVQSLTPRQFKVFIYLISSADDDGRLKATWTLFPARIFPLGGVSSEDIRGDIDLMHTMGLIEVYGDDRTQYIAHPNWTTYQKINRKTDSKLPAPDSLPDRRIPSDAHEPLTDNSLSTHERLTPNRIEVKVREVNIYGDGAAAETLDAENGTTPAATPLKRKEKKPVDPLVQLLMTSFAEKQPDAKYVDNSYAKEWQGCAALVREARARASPPTTPEIWLRRVCSKFEQLRGSADSFWSRQPCLPSVLAAQGILPRVLDTLEHSAPGDNLDWVEEATK